MQPPAQLWAQTVPSVAHRVNSGVTGQGFFFLSRVSFNWKVTPGLSYELPEGKISSCSFFI